MKTREKNIRFTKGEIRKINLKKRLLKIRSYISKNHLILLGIIIPTLIAIAICYYTFTDPDIRYSSIQPHISKLLDYKVDERGNLVYFFTAILKFKNLSIKSGFVDKAEIAPLSISTIPETKIISIEKLPLGWREEKQIEIKFFIIISNPAIQALEHSNHISLEVILNFYDNIGKKIYMFDNGPYTYARITLNLEQFFTKITKE